tara:strand:- start:183 stop:332 length:150 start_codon:yes stop_codon:yes gene_type:complete
MKIVNQWLVFNRNVDQVLCETENGKYYLYTYHAGFLEIPSDEAKKLINP